MHPVVELFGHAIPSYGLMGLLGASLGLLFAVWVSRSELFLFRETKIDTENVIYIYVLSFAGALCGAKVLYLVTVLPSFLQEVTQIYNDPVLFVSTYLSGGFVLYGGLAGGYLTARLVAKSYHVALSQYYPALLPSLAIVCGFGRIGCFMAGCCFGAEAPYGCPLAVVFPPESLAPAGVPLIPTQLIEAGADFLLFFVMLAITNHARLASLSLHIYLILYSVFRFVLEFFRGDVVRGFFLGLSTSQWIALIVVICVLGHLLYIKKFQRQRSA